MEELYFKMSNYDRSLNAYNNANEYIKEHNQEIVISKYFDAFNEVFDLALYTFPHSEAQYELKNSLELCKFGFYRYSLIALRSVLELGLLGIYFDKQSYSKPKEYWKWHKSEDPTPKFQKILLNDLFSEVEFKVINSKFKIRRQIMKTYQTLSNYTHTQGQNFSLFSLTNSNFIRYSEISLIRYLELMKVVIEHLVILYLTNNLIVMQESPGFEKFGFFAPGFLSINRLILLSIISEEIRIELQNLSDNSEAVRNQLNALNSLPDLSEEQIEEQRKSINLSMKSQITL